MHLSISPCAWWQSQNSTAILLCFIHCPTTFRMASLFPNPSNSQSQIFSWFLLAHICYSQLCVCFTYCPKCDWALVWTTEPCVTNNTPINSHRIIHSWFTWQMLFSFPSWMPALNFSTANGHFISQWPFLDILKKCHRLEKYYSKNFWAHNPNTFINYML